MNWRNFKQNYVEYAPHILLEDLDDGGVDGADTNDGPRKEFSRCKWVDSALKARQQYV